jgi:ABC-type uncharacterized transport system ATPase subunit
MSKRDARVTWIRAFSSRSFVASQKQRLEIVCALNQQPKVLILDDRSGLPDPEALHRHNFLHRIGGNHGGLIGLVRLGLLGVFGFLS